MRVFGVLLVVSCIALLPSRPAWGQSSDEAARAAARLLGTSGVEAFQNGQYAAASESLEKAYQVLRAPSLGLWSARALAKTGKLVEAAARYREVMHLSITTGDEDIQSKAQIDVVKDLEKLTPRIPSLDVRLQGDAANATVTVDGAAVALSPRPTVNPGTHHVEASLGAAKASADVTVAEGETKTVTLALDAAPASAPVAQSPTPSTPPALEAAHGLGTQRTLAIVAGGLGVAGIAVGAIFGLESKSSHDKEADQGCSSANCPNTAGAQASRDAVHEGNVSTIAFAVGLAGVASGAALWFTAKDAPVQVGAQPGGLTVRGVF